MALGQNAAGIDPETMRMLIAQLLAQQGGGDPGRLSASGVDASGALPEQQQWPADPSDPASEGDAATASPGPIDSAAPAGYVSTGFQDMGYGATPAGMVSQGHAAVNDPGPGYGSQGFASQGPTSAAAMSQSAIDNAMGSLQSPSAFNAPSQSAFDVANGAMVAPSVNSEIAFGGLLNPDNAVANPAPDNLGGPFDVTGPGWGAPVGEVTGPAQTGAPTGNPGAVAVGYGVGLGLGDSVGGGFTGTGSGPSGDGTSGATAEGGGVGVGGASTGISGGPGGTGEGGANTGEGGGGGGGAGGGGSK